MHNRKLLDAHLEFSLGVSPAVISVSHSIKDLLGFNSSEFTSGKVSFQSRVHADDQDLYTILFSSTDKYSSESFTLRLRQSNNHIRIVRVFYSKSPQETGTILKVTLQDAKSIHKVTDQCGQMIYFKAMMENTNDYIYFKDANHVFTGASQSLVSLCEPVEHWTDFLGLTDYDVFPEKYADIYYRLEKQLFSGVPIAQEIQKMLSTDGKEGWVDNRKYPIYDDDHSIVGLFGVARDITEIKQAEEQVWHEANYDHLTGLPNRALFFDRLSKEIIRSRRNKKYAAILFLDLDGFKDVNDVYGHEAGDYVLVCIAERWIKCLRDVDTLARIGGDEFAVIIDDLTTPDAIEIVANKLIEAASLKITLLSNQECQIGVSIGASIYPQHGVEMDTLVSAADTAMYESKNQGKNAFNYASARALDNHPENWIVLDEAHLVSVDEIDDQHREIVRLVNQINCEVYANNNSKRVESLFEELVNYTLFHFESEHQLMEESCYPDMASHDRAHEALIVHVQRLSKEIQKGNSLLLLQTMKDWLLKHVIYCDKPLADYLNRHAYNE